MEVGEGRVLVHTDRMTLRGAQLVMPDPGFNRSCRFRALCYLDCRFWILLPRSASKCGMMSVKWLGIFVAVFLLLYL